MLHAFLHHKLSPEQENMEDILTSIVFGLAKYFPADVLAPFVAEAVTLDGQRPLAFLAERPERHTVRLQFWPRFKEPRC